MNYKIYSFKENKSFDFTELNMFFEFEIKPYKSNEFIVFRDNKKISVQSGEVFEFLQNEYFIFNSTQINFIHAPQFTQKIYFSLFQFKNLKFSSKFYLALFLTSLLLFYRNSLSTLDA